MEDDGGSKKTECPTCGAAPQGCQSPSGPARRSRFPSVLANALTLVALLGVFTFQYKQDRSSGESPKIVETIAAMALPGEPPVAGDQLPTREEMLRECGPTKKWAELGPNPLADEWVADDRFGGQWCVRRGVVTCLTDAVLWYRRSVPPVFSVIVVARTRAPMGPRVVVHASKAAVRYHGLSSDTRLHDGGVWCSWGLMMDPFPVLGWEPGRFRECGLFRVEKGTWHEQAVVVRSRTVNYAIDGKGIFELSNAPLRATARTVLPESDTGHVGIVVDYAQIRSATLR